MKIKICSVGECMIEIANTKNNIFQQSFAGDTLNFCNYIDKKYFENLENAFPGQLLYKLWLIITQDANFGAIQRTLISDISKFHLYIKL